MCEQMPPKKDNEDLNAPMNALNLKDPGSDDEAGAADPALVPDPAGDDELSEARRELSVAEQALTKAQIKVYNLSMHAMEQIIIDGAEQGLATSTIRTKISDYRKKNNILRGITLQKGRFDTLYKEHFVKGGGVSGTLISFEYQ